MLHSKQYLCLSEALIFGHTFDDNTILSIVFSIDYYIMIALYFLYMASIKTKKEGESNGTLGNTLDV